MIHIIKKNVKINKTFSITTCQANAIKDPIRTKIIQILYHDELSTDQIFSKLTNFGFKKSLPTIRHHIDILKDSKFIEIAKIKESRGTVIKFYRSTTCLLDFSVPANIITNYYDIINILTEKLKNLLKIILKHKLYNNIDLSHIDSNYTKFILMELLNLALTNIFENSSSKNTISKFEFRKSN